MKLLRLLLAPAAAVLLSGAAPTSDLLDAPAQRVRADVEFLAGDLLEGRDTGSRGYAIGAAYVAAQMRAIGLKPGGPNGSWYQQVPFRRASRAGGLDASLAIGSRTVPLKPGVEIAIRPSLTQQSRNVDAPLVFAGHGISDARLGIDNYAGLDVRGKIVIALRGTPPGLPSEIAAHLDSVKGATAVAKGAAGLLEIAGTGTRAGSGSIAFLDGPITDWVDPGGKAASVNARLGVHGAISRSAAERLLRAARQDLSRILGQARGRRALRGFALPARLRFNDRMEWQNFISPNVIGLLPGADPALASEHVVLMGHLDHLGVNAAAKPGEDAIYNGAIDNAAGIATMLEAARDFAASGKPPRRSVLFIANTGEERGLRGADYFAANPTVPIGQIIGAVDLDMPMLLYPFTDVIAFGGDHSTVARDIAAAARSMGIKVSPDPMPEEAIFVRSDHYRFVTRGIPAILLMTGHANGGKAKWDKFLGQVYHKPHDDLGQQILWDQGARYAQLNYRIARALADADGRPLWYQGDYFGDSYAPGLPRARK